MVEDRGRDDADVVALPLGRLAAQVDPLADIRHQLAKKGAQFVGQLARHPRHQGVEPSAARGEPLDEITRAAALLDHAVQAVAVGAQRDRRLPGQPVPQHLGIPQHEHQSHGRCEGIALADADADVRAGWSDEFQQGDAVVDDGGQRRGGAVDRREAAQFVAGGGFTRIDSCAVWPSEMSAGPSR